jgi:hypothetical protein
MMVVLSTFRLVLSREISNSGAGNMPAPMTETDSFLA